MPEHLRALAVILMLATAVFALARAPVCAMATAGADFVRRRNLWIGIVATAYLAHNFWIYIVVTAFLLYREAPREHNQTALFFFILFVVPGFSGRVPGLGIINYLVDIGFHRLLILIVLLPAFLSLQKDPETPRFGLLVPDKFIGGYLILQLGLMLVASTFTNTLRVGVVYAFIDVFLPYFVISRSLRNIEAFRDALAAFVISALVLSAIGAVEGARHWLLYAPLDQALGIESEWGAYLERGGEGGQLRAQGSTGHAIPLGYVMAIALTLYLYLRSMIASKTVRSIGMLVLLVGLYVPLSRGPWVGAAAMVLVMLLTGPSPVLHLTRLGVLGAVILPALFATSAGEAIYRLLPFVGEQDHTVTYRQQLIEVSLDLVMDNPFFGAYDYIFSPAMQELKQGQGIIDVVNSYVAIALGSGLIGLGLFAGFFLSIALEIFRAMRRVPDKLDERYVLGQALLTVILGILIIIGTVSSVTIIPIVYWSMAGVGVAYASMMAREPSAQTEKRDYPQHAGNPVSSPVATTS
jgi:O-antigen ligase